MKMRKNLVKTLAILLCLTIMAAVNLQAATTLTNNATGTIDGYNYELWKDSGTTSMTLNGGGTFSCSWSNINNALFRIGKKFDSTKTHQQLGNITVNYGCNYSPNGNSYLCVYGWTRSPLIEYYIVDSWGSWRPPGGSSKGTINIDGGTYDVYQTQRVNQPSIDGTQTFYQFWSVRTAKKTSGTISVTQHFNAWASKGMTLGKMYEVATTVEGYQSSGNANVYSNTINIGGGSNPTPTPPPTGSYARFRNVAKGLYIDGMGSTSNGSNCCQWSSSTSYNQQWAVESVSGYYKFKNRQTGLYLDGMGRTSNGSICGQWSSSSSNNQQWSQETVGGNYKYKNRATGLYLDGMGSSGNGSNLCQWSSSSSTNQQWQKQ
jgi:endo-1,4-beta-xylanase